MEDNLSYYKRFKTETIYLYNDESECYIKSTPKDGFFVKHPDHDEKPIAADSDVVVKAIDMKKEVTKSKYEST